MQAEDQRTEGCRLSILKFLLCFLKNDFALCKLLDLSFLACDMVKAIKPPISRAK